jgi:hypothetical protein
MNGDDEIQIKFSQGPMIGFYFLLVLNGPLFYDIITKPIIQGRIQDIWVTSILFCVITFLLIRGHVIRFRNKHAFVLDGQGIFTWNYGLIKWQEIKNTQFAGLLLTKAIFLEVKDPSKYNKRTIFTPFPLTFIRPRLRIPVTWLNIEGPRLYHSLLQYIHKYK